MTTMMMTTRVGEVEVEGDVDVEEEGEGGEVCLAVLVKSNNKSLQKQYLLYIYSITLFS